MKTNLKAYIRQQSANFALGLGTIHQGAQDLGSRIVSDEFLEDRYNKAMTGYEDLYDSMLSKEENAAPKDEYMQKMGNIQKWSNSNLRNIAGYGAGAAGLAAVGGAGYGLYRLGKKFMRR